MNRYQQELAEMDQRRGWRVRILSAAIAAVVIASAMWSGGVPRPSWFARESSASLPPAEPQLLEVSRQVDPSETTTTSRLRLVSTSPGQNSTDGAAQIATSGDAALTFAAGALLPNGATLQEIYADRVLLTRGSHKTFLFIDGMAEPATSARGASVDNSLLRVDEQELPIPRAEKSPPTYSEFARAAPRFQDDQIIGFDLYPGTNASLFSRAGLQAADLLIAIDGSPVVSVDAYHDAMKGLNEGRSFVATIRRGDVQIDLSINGSAGAEVLASVPPSLP